MFTNAICDQCWCSHVVAELVLADGEPVMACPSCTGAWPTTVDWLDARCTGAWPTLADWLDARITHHWPIAAPPGIGPGRRFYDPGCLRETLLIAKPGPSTVGGVVEKIAEVALTR
jgi:hypothetical protein